jgi:hypothetical protein
VLGLTRSLHPKTYGGTMSLSEYQILTPTQLSAVLKTSENWRCPGTQGISEGATLRITPDVRVRVRDGVLTIDWTAMEFEFKFTEIRQISKYEIELWYTDGDDTNRRSRCALKLVSESLAQVERRRTQE